MCVNVDRVHGRRPLVEILVGVALLCAPLAGRFVAVTGPVDAALVGIRHLYNPVRGKIQHDKQPGGKIHSRCSEEVCYQFFRVGFVLAIHVNVLVITVFVILFLLHLTSCIIKHT